MPGGRPETQLDPRDGPLAAFAADLRALRAAAGSPTYRQMAALSGVPVGSLARAAGGRTLPGVEVVRAYVKACAGDEGRWIARWRLLATDEQARRRRQRQSGATRQTLDQPVS